MTTLNPIIRRATKDDLSAVLDMIQALAALQELADFEAMPNGPKLNLEALIRDGGYDDNIKTSPLFYSYVAEVDELVNENKIIETENNESSERPLTRDSSKSDSRRVIVGYTLLFFTYSSWEGKAVFLEDIYVKNDYRKQGIGKLLYKEAVQFAKDSGCCRFEFHVLDWNPARKFYEKLGAKNITESEGWFYYRLNDEGIKQLLS